MPCGEVKDSRLGWPKRCCGRGVIAVDTRHDIASSSTRRDIVGLSCMSVCRGNVVPRSCPAQVVPSKAFFLARLRAEAVLSSGCPGLGIISWPCSGVDDKLPLDFSILSACPCSCLCFFASYSTSCHHPEQLTTRRPPLTSSCHHPSPQI